jgi:hypothetical protein
MGLIEWGVHNETEQHSRNLTELSTHMFHTAYWSLKTNSAIWFTIKWARLGGGGGAEREREKKKRVTIATI